MIKMTKDLHLKKHQIPRNFKDKIALSFVKCMRFFADTFFQKRYGHRAVILETIAAIPGMVAGMLIHFKCLRQMKDDHGWIKELLDEAENERMHLMTFIHIARPNLFERFIIIIAQGIFSLFYLILYLCSPYTAHRVVGYLEEEAVISYSRYLNEVEEGRMPNSPVPSIAIKYWDLPKHSKLVDLIQVVREDECKHRDINHHFANDFLKGKK